MLTTKYLGTALGRTLLYLALLGGALLSLAPYLMTLNSAFKRPEDLLRTQPWTPASPATFDNFSEVWTKYDMSGFLLHTILVAGWSRLARWSSARSAPTPSRGSNSPAGTRCSGSSWRP